MPPKIPKADLGKFIRAAGKLLNILFPLFDDSSIYDEMELVTH